MIFNVQAFWLPTYDDILRMMNTANLWVDVVTGYRTLRSHTGLLMFSTRLEAKEG